MEKQGKKEKREKRGKTEKAILPRVYRIGPTGHLRSQAIFSPISKQLFLP
jgi:hypothetical protein